MILNFLALALSTGKALLPLYVYRRIGIKQKNLFACYIAGFALCVSPLARALVRFTSISLVDSEYSEYYFSHLVFYDMIFILTFLFSLFLLTRISRLLIFLPVLSVKNLRNCFISINQNLARLIPSYLLFFLLALLFLSLLISLSPAHTLWITNPRVAYITGRRGLGVVFILFVFSVNLFAYFSAKSFYTVNHLPGPSLTRTKYLLYKSFAILMAISTGTKSVPICVLLTSLIVYLLSNASVNHISILQRFTSKLRLKYIAIFILSLVIISLIFIWRSLSGTTLVDYFAETPFLLDQINFVKTHRDSLGSPTNPLVLFIAQSLPKSLSWIFNLGSTPSVEYTSIILGIDPEDMIDFPAIDQSLFALYAFGKLSFVMPILSAFTEAIPYALLIRLCINTQTTSRLQDYNLLVCSSALSYLPLVPQLFCLNIFTILSLA